MTLEAIGLARKDEHSGAMLLHPTQLKLAPRDRLVLSGPSGAGKSVLLRALALLDQTEGTLLWQGQTVARAQVPAYRRTVAYLRQRPALFGGTVEDNLLTPFSLGIYRGLAFDRAPALAYFARAGHDAAFLAQQADELSGGEQQLVALVRTLQLGPTVLLLDEPTASLDPETAVMVEAIVDAWYQQTPEAAWIWVTHDPAQGKRVGARFAILKAGVLSTD